jgi:hypothetical protein
MSSPRAIHYFRERLVETSVPSYFTIVAENGLRCLARAQPFPRMRRGKCLNGQEFRGKRETVNILHPCEVPLGSLKF